MGTRVTISGSGIQVGGLIHTPGSSSCSGGSGEVTRDGVSLDDTPPAEELPAPSTFPDECGEVNVECCSGEFKDVVDSMVGTPPAKGVPA